MTVRVAIGPSAFGDQDPAPLRLLEERGIEVVRNPLGRRLSESEVIDHLRGVDGLIAGGEPLNHTVLACAKPRLRAIARVGFGLENVDLEAAEDLNIKVSHTPGPPARAVAEMTLAAMLALVRGLLPANAALHRREWIERVSPGLDETAVLIVGYGRIGRRVGELVRAFGGRILVSDPHIDPAALYEDEPLVSLDEGLALARIVTLHAGGDERLIGRRELGLMAEGSYLLNAGGGALVEEAAVTEALESGRLAGAWFDRFWIEPYRGELCDQPAALLTPHLGTHSERCRRAMETEAVMNLLKDLEVIS